MVNKDIGSSDPVNERGQQSQDSSRTWAPAGNDTQQVDDVDRVVVVDVRHAGEELANGYLTDISDLDIF
jgi:hypothetical protein